MGQTQSSSSAAAATASRRQPLLLGQTPFCATAAIGTDIHVMAPGTIQAAKQETSKSVPTANKKTSRFGTALSLAKKGAKLAAQGAKAGANMLLGQTLHPRLIPRTEATRVCFLCLCSAIPEDAGKAAAYGVPCLIRANINGGAVLRKGRSDGHYEFKGTDLESGTRVIIVSTTGREPGSAIFLGDQFIVLNENGTRVMIFAASADGGIEIQSKPRDEVQAGASAIFVAAKIPPELAAPKPEASNERADLQDTRMGTSDTSLFAGLLGSMAIAGAVGGQVAQDKVVKDFATARYSGESGLTNMLRDMSLARNFTQAGPGRFLVNQGMGMAMNHVLGAAAGKKR